MGAWNAFSGGIRWYWWEITWQARFTFGSWFTWVAVSAGFTRRAFWTSWACVPVVTLASSSLTSLSWFSWCSSTFHDHHFFPCIFGQQVEFIHVTLNFEVDARNLLPKHRDENEASQNGTNAEKHGSDSGDFS